jgi:hypothetical protein
MEDRVKTTQDLQEVLELNKSFLKDFDDMIRTLRKNKSDAGKYWLYYNDYVIILSERDITIKKKFAKK